MTNKTSNTTSNTSNVSRIIKIATCPSSSGKANLTYHMGCNEDKEVYVRIVANTGGGYLSAEWVKLADIISALETAKLPITSFPLIKLFKGKSTNTPGFMLAVLKHEGLVKPLEGKIRGYEKLDFTAFQHAVNQLAASDVDLKPNTDSPSKKSATPISSKKPKQV